MKKLEFGALEATLAELFLVGRTGSAGRRDWTVDTGMPFVPHLAILSQLTITLVNFFRQDCAGQFGEEYVVELRDRLWHINDRAASVWAKAMKDPEAAIQNPTLDEDGPVRKRVAGLERWCRRRVGHGFDDALLSEYTDNVQDSLAGFNRHATKVLTAAMHKTSGSETEPELAYLKLSVTALGKLAGGLLGRCASDDELLIAGGIAAVGASKPDGLESTDEPDWARLLRKNFNVLSKALPK